MYDVEILVRKHIKYDGWMDGWTHHMIAWLGTCAKNEVRYM